MPEPADDLYALGRAIRRLRRERDLSQEMVADLARMSLNHYGEIERGRKEVRWTTVAKIARALEVPVSELARRAEVGRRGAK